MWMSLAFFPCSLVTIVDHLGLAAGVDLEAEADSSASGESSLALDRMSDFLSELMSVEG